MAARLALPRAPGLALVGGPVVAGPLVGGLVLDLADRLGGRAHRASAPGTARGAPVGGHEAEAGRSPSGRRTGGRTSVEARSTIVIGTGHSHAALSGARNITTTSTTTWSQKQPSPGPCSASSGRALVVDVLRVPPVRGARDQRPCDRSTGAIDSTQPERHSGAGSSGPKYHVSRWTAPVDRTSNSPATNHVEPSGIVGRSHP